MKKYKSATVPYAVYESAMARSSRDKKRWNAALVASTIIATVVVSAALAVNNLIWQKYALRLIGK